MLLLVAELFCFHQQVTDDSQLLTGVLVSLSGGAGYRKNNLTDENGTISFNNLVKN